MSRCRLDLAPQLNPELRSNLALVLKPVREIVFDAFGGKIRKPVRLITSSLLVLSAPVLRRIRCEQAADHTLIGDFRVIDAPWARSGGAKVSPFAPVSLSRSARFDHTETRLYRIDRAKKRDCRASRVGTREALAEMKRGRSPTSTKRRTSNFCLSHTTERSSPGRCAIF